MRHTAACTAIAIVALAACAAAAAPPGSCPANVTTSCDGNSTCCSQMFSGSGYGCCKGLGPNAVCCGLQGCCPEGWTCKNTPPWSSACVPPGGTETYPATQVCTPGPQFPPSPTVPSAIVIGDSVSIGYTPQVIALLNASAHIQVQHSPWSGGGGADDIQNAVNCEEEFLRTASYSPATWDLISFNSGLHNLDNSSAAEEAYLGNLTAFTDRLLATGSKLVYVTTTPYMPDRFFNNTVVEQLNALAVGLMASKGIPVADLYSHVIAKCGQVYKNCSICDDEYNPSTGITCGYHYNPMGWQYLAEFLAPIYSSILGLREVV